MGKADKHMTMIALITAAILGVSLASNVQLSKEPRAASSDCEATSTTGGE